MKTEVEQTWFVWDRRRCYYSYVSWATTWREGLIYHLGPVATATQVDPGRYSDCISDRTPSRNYLLVSSAGKGRVGTLGECKSDNCSRSDPVGLSRAESSNGSMRSFQSISNAFLRCTNKKWASKNPLKVTYWTVPLFLHQSIPSPPHP